MDILDEDHLEFEEILLNLQERAEQAGTQLKHLTEKVSESRTETLETREMIENLEVKIDRLLALVTGWRREHIE
jgi:methyl-accepting chemotaxis protein